MKYEHHPIWTLITVLFSVVITVQTITLHYSFWRWLIVNMIGTAIITEGAIRTRPDS